MLPDTNTLGMTYTAAHSQRAANAASIIGSVGPRHAPRVVATPPGPAQEPGDANALDHKVGALGMQR